MERKFITTQARHIFPGCVVLTEAKQDGDKARTVVSTGPASFLTDKRPHTLFMFATGDALVLPDTTLVRVAVEAQEV